MSSLRRQEEALVALSYPQVAYRLEGGYGNLGNPIMGLVGAVTNMVSTGMATVSQEKQLESRLTTEVAIRQAEIVADSVIKQQMAADAAAMAPVKWAIGGLLGVAVVLGGLKAAKVI